MSNEEEALRALAARVLDCVGAVDSKRLARARRRYAELKDTDEFYEAFDSARVGVPWPVFVDLVDKLEELFPGIIERFEEERAAAKN